MCLQPFVSRRDRSNCTQVCPSRRGQRRGDVVGELVRGRSVEGLHPRSPLIIQAQARLASNAQTSGSGALASRDEVTELENRIRLLEHQRDEMRTIILTLQIQGASGHDANQQNNSSWPESESGAQAE